MDLRPMCNKIQKAISQKIIDICLILKQNPVWSGFPNHTVFAGNYKNRLYIGT